MWEFEQALALMQGQQEAAQASSAAAHDARNQPATAGSTTVQLLGAISVHVLGKLAELLRSYPQSFGRVRADCRHYLVVQVGNNFFCFAIYFLGCFAEFCIQLAPKAFESCFGLGTVLLIHLLFSPSGFTGRVAADYKRVIRASGRS